MTGGLQVRTALPIINRLNSRSWADQPYSSCSMMATQAETAESQEQVRVFLWGLPRSISTAMTKCMSFVDGVQIWFEPYLYSYHNEKIASLSRLEDRELMKGMVLGDNVERAMDMMKRTPRGKMIDNDLYRYPWVKSQLETLDPDTKFIFIKDMAHVMNNRYEYLPTSKFRHTFLIRDPIRMYSSFFRLFEMLQVPGDLNKNETIKMLKEIVYDTDRIYEYTYNLWRYTKEHLDSDAIIIDSTELAAQPEKLLPKYFEAIGVPYRERYLNWDPSSDIITEWIASFQSFMSAYGNGVHTTAADSGCFMSEKPLPSRACLSPDILHCIESAQPYYDEMYAQRLKP